MHSTRWSSVPSQDILWAQAALIADPVSHHRYIVTRARAIASRNANAGG